MTRIAVIGCGHWGPNHIRVFNNLPDSKVCAVADLDEQRLRRVGGMYPSVRCEQDYQRVVTDPNIDAVVIATPTQTHYQIARESLLAGKHVLCEKPLCEQSNHGKELVELSHASGCLLMVGHVFLFNAGIAKLKGIIDAGELGAIQYLAASRTNLGPIRSDVNVAYDLATHDVSIFNWLLGGEPELVSAMGASFLQPGIEDVVFISAKYPHNAVANIQASWLDPKKVRQITIVGNRCMATWDDLQSTTPVAIYDKGVNAVQDYGDFGEFLRLSMWDGDVRMPKVHSDEPLKCQAIEFLKYVQQGRVERSDGVFALGVVKVLEAVTASLRLNGSPVRVGS